MVNTNANNKDNKDKKGKKGFSIILNVFQKFIPVLFLFLPIFFYLLMFSLCLSFIPVKSEESVSEKETAQIEQTVKTEQTSDESSITIATENLYFVEFVYGNGETWKGMLMDPYITLPDHPRLKVTCFDSEFDPEYQNGSIILPGNRPFSLSEAYDIQYDNETETLVVFLWRDEPYELEKDILKKIE